MVQMTSALNGQMTQNNSFGITFNFGSIQMQFIAVIDAFAFSIKPTYFFYIQMLRRRKNIALMKEMTNKDKLVWV